MPATFPAHQGLILGAKLRWPRHVDATALCVGAASPDLAYPLGDWLNRESHTAVGLLVWSIPIALVISVTLRRWASPGLFSCLPNLGPLKLRSYAVLRERRPQFAVTVTSAALGAGSHVLIDGFTHTGRWGANWLDLNETVFTAPVRGAMSGARALQYVGHIGGSILFVVLLLAIASSGRLVEWYGGDAVAAASARNARATDKLIFAALVFLPSILAVLGSGLRGVDAVFLAQTCVVFSAVVAGAVVTRLQDARPDL